MRAFFNLKMFSKLELDVTGENQPQRQKLAVQFSAYLKFSNTDIPWKFCWRPINFIMSNNGQSRAPRFKLILEQVNISIPILEKYDPTKIYNVFPSNSLFGKKNGGMLRVSALRLS